MIYEMNTQKGLDHIIGSIMIGFGVSGVRGICVIQGNDQGVEAGRTRQFDGSIYRWPYHIGKDGNFPCYFHILQHWVLQKTKITRKIGGFAYNH